MDFKRIALAALVSSVVASSAFSDQQQGEEQDSVHEWGPWAIR
ncbi:hypothetical protein [Neptuniibacter sp. 1_MG-2023]|nr:hypothetical protein [Neptuniibacter sp. 1_MG-2023]MDO6592630.1 hypothetical protein [Neptuniibacter sp. 1_MG-2023]